MGTVQKGFKFPVYRTNIEEPKKVLTMKRTTRSQLRKGARPSEGAERSETDSRQAARRVAAGAAINAMGKSSADEQEPHPRPTWWKELAQHSEVPSFSHGGNTPGM
jgi:hypothetical protein